MAATVKELHFFPGASVMLWVVGAKPLLKASAWGGEKPELGKHYDVMKPRQTTPGRYVIYSYEPYRTNTWAWSKIAWGTKLTVDATRDSVLFETRLGRKQWTSVEERIPGATKSVIQARYYTLYGLSGKHDSDGDLVPEIWVFNDFGAYAVRYFKDKNRNKQLDQGDEALSGEMIHTTPENEAQVEQNEPVVFEHSHGCIHLNPIERDKLHDAGAFERGTALIIHDYGETVPAAFN